MKWGKKEELYLAENYSTRMPLEEISGKLGRTIRSVQRKAQEMGISRPRKKFSVEKLRVRQKRANDKFYLQNNKKIYLRKKRRRHDIKRELISLKGGECEMCGYNKCISALEFHHKGKNKDGHLTTIIKNSSKQKALKEVEKCILLCANCHRELHSKGVSDNVSPLGSSPRSWG